MRRVLLAIGLGFALCLAGAGFAATSLYLPGLALLLIAVVAAAWVASAAHGLRLLRSLGGTVVEERAALPITVSLANARLPSPGAELRAWPDGPAVAVSGLQDGTITATVCFPRRGRHRLGPASLLVSDPLGLCSRTITSSASEVLVLPSVEPVHLVEVGGEPATLGRHAISALHAAATEVDSLQPHLPGSPGSRIHWPTVARTTTLMERRLVADGETGPLVVVDPREPSSGDALDQAMRAAASLCLHLARSGGGSLLLPGDSRPARIEPTLSGFSAAHVRLALLTPEVGAPPLGCIPGSSKLLWVTAAAGPPAQLAQFAAPVRYLVSPHPVPRWPVQFTVAGCSGQRLDRDPAHRRAAER